VTITRVLAGIAVADIEAAKRWYEKLLGKPADDVPMASAAEWHLAAGGSIQLSEDADRAGRGTVNLSVDDFDAALAEAAGRGIVLEEVEIPSGMFRVATTADPEGNLVVFSQDLRRGGA